MVKRIFITPSNREFHDVLKEDSAEGESNWTVNCHAQPGDTMLLYICAPVSAIVAICTVATVPERNADPSSEWFGHCMADVHSLRMLDRQIARAELLAKFPGWGYWKQPRDSVRVPEPYRDALSELIEGL